MLLETDDIFPREKTFLNYAEGMQKKVWVPFIILGDIKYIRRIEYINQPHKEIETGRNYFEFMTNLK